MFGGNPFWHEKWTAIRFDLCSSRNESTKYCYFLYTAIRSATLRQSKRFRIIPEVISDCLSGAELSLSVVQSSSILSRGCSSCPVSTGCSCIVARERTSIIFLIRFRFEFGIGFPMLSFCWLVAQGSAELLVFKT